MNKILTLLTVTSLALNAQTFNVTTTPEFRTALQNAAMNGEDDTIVFSDGTYKTTDDAGGRFEYLDNEVYDLTLIGSSRENVILSGDGVDQIFRHQSITGADLKVEKLSFIDGGSTFYVSGGAVYSDLATVNVIDCNFTNNHTSHRGGAIYITRDINILNTIFNNNSANEGGGFFTYGKVTVDNSIFSNNTSSGSGTYFYDGGGGFHATTQITVTVSDSNFTNNTSYSSGGGFYCNVAEVSNSNFIANKACALVENETGGGGFGTSQSARVLNSYFDKNIACHGGGFSSFYITVIDSIFTDNNSSSIVSGSGGGGFSTLASAGNTIIDSSTFSENHSKSNGGGVFLGGKAVITNSIFTNNRADGVGAGLYAGNLYMSNSMLTNNSDGVYLSNASSASNPQIIKNSIFIDNYIQDVSADPQSDISGHADAVAVIDNNYIDTYNIHVQNLSKNNIFANVTLGFEDAVNENYHLTSSSDLIDAGTSDYADKFIVDGVNYLEYDYEDNNRSVGADMDIGIYAVQLPVVNPALILYLLN